MTSEKKFKILEKEEVFRDSFFHIENVSLSVNKFDGGQIKMSRYAMERPRVVAILLRHIRRDSFILVEQFRYSTAEFCDGFPREIVAGIVESKDPDPYSTALRECLEETGYAPRKLDHVFDFMPSLGISNQLVHLYYGEVDDSMRIEKGGGLIEEEEDIRVVEEAISTTHGKCRRGEVLDAKSLIAFQWYFMERSGKGSGNTYQKTTNL